MVTNFGFAQEGRIDHIGVLHTMAILAMHLPLFIPEVCSHIHKEFSYMTKMTWDFRSNQSTHLDGRLEILENPNMHEIWAS